MTFDEVLAQIQELLQREKRVSYRGLKRRFALDDDYLEDLKEELIGAKRLATDEEGRFLVWRGEHEPAVALSRLPSHQPSSPPAEPRPAEAERRQLTVMFCDLVGSTALSAQLDPEDYRAVVQQYQQTCMAVIQRHEGYLAQYLGDGLLVYFGYPSAHEDDARRAVCTGVEIVEALKGQGRPQPLQVRIGIHTGLVVVGEMGGGRRQEQLALGETPNIAARIQGQATPDEVLISAATYRLVEGLFACEERGYPELKGITAPLLLYRVVKEEEAQSRFQVVARQGLTPLIGREHEYGLLRERWERVKDGTGQIVLLSGEPGIGKSRLVEALKETVEQEGARCLELRCSPYYQNSALYPVIEHVQRGLKFQAEESAEEKLHKLAGGASALHLHPEALPLLAALLSLSHPEGYPSITLSPQKQKEKTYEALVAWLCEDATQQAVVYAWEDLHWADPSTLELLALFLAHVPTIRLLAVFTARPEFTPPWGSHSYLSPLTLSRLGRSQVEVMVERVAGGKALPKEVVQQIISKTDGVPLFVEELTKMVLESGLVREEEGRYVGAQGGTSLPLLAIPSTLQDSLMARLDRLAPVREIAQVGAVLGREFSYDLLHAVARVEDSTLQHGLRQLVDAELLYPRGLPPHATYLFKHALIQDTAYHSLLKSKRRQLHQETAQVLAARFPETMESQAELLAHHYTEANLLEQAIPYWQRAGQRASQRSANVEAIAHLSKGLELLKTLPDTPGRAQQELSLQLALGPALMVTKSISHADVENAYTRARELCQQIGETRQLFPVLWGLRRFYSLRADYKTVQELEAQLLHLAQSAQDSALLLEAQLGRGLTLFWLGQMTSARECFGQGITLYNPQQHHSHAFLYGTDPGVACRSYAALALWHLGYPDQALQESQRALALAQDLTHPFSLVYALSCLTWVHHLRREAQAAQEQIEKALRLATEQGFPFWVAWGSVLRGWALAMQTQGEEAMAQTHQGLATHRAIGAEIGRTWFHAMLADVYKTRGQSEEGLHVLTEALDATDKRGERAYEAELYRLQGELLREQEGRKEKTEEVEKCFLKAIDIARQQQAKSLELRAVMSLARLWQYQGKQQEAHDMLAKIYGWFTEGFDTKDLQEAKALLDELAEGH